ncbi:hypothetical protein [Xylophilus ampelinus]|uniref:hypothetical protein n=1 Tax=Xylophilus ampelinus TaxID=54067 RepID=UPI0011B72DE8|nr:hypothetical protein [Xylophilus ampelinus]MCS4511900.1 hypothetical protein [Xylophilus ampelinus]
MADHVSWLSDHAAGSDFYNDSANLAYFPNDPDYEGSARSGWLHNLLKAAGLDVDDAPLIEKTNAGISSPIVIDLGGDGIETTSLLAGSSVYFDIDGNGESNKTAWISGKDAFLAIDKNKNGKIDGVNELFGGPERGEGYLKLSALDSSKDGFIEKMTMLFLH